MLFAVKLFEDHGIKVDRAELLSLNIITLSHKVMINVNFTPNKQTQFLHSHHMSHGTVSRQKQIFSIY